MESTGWLQNLQDKIRLLETQYQTLLNEKLSTEKELISAREKAEMADKLKINFLNNLSHEIRTPLNGIVGFAELLRQNDLDSDQREKYLEIVLQSANQLLRIITDIIEASRIESGDVKIHKSEVSLNNLLIDIKNQYKSELLIKKKDNVQMIIKTGLIEEEAYIYADLAKVRQILSNIIDNAIKFTFDGHIEIGYTLKDDKTLLFYIEDTGIGISPEKTSIIFDRFRQIDDKVDRQFGGTGIGLTIAKGLVNFLGGTISVRSELNKGSIFHFTLPYEPVYIETETFQVDEGVIYNWKDKLVLVVEDEFMNYQYLEEILKQTNIQIIHALNGFEAIELCKFNNLINIVLMDMQLPMVDGYDATRQIRKLRKELPIIAQTAHAIAEDRDKCIAAGCDDYIPKPIDRKVLFLKMSKFLA